MAKKIDKINVRKHGNKYNFYFNNVYHSSFETRQEAESFGKLYLELRLVVLTSIDSYMFDYTKRWNKIMGKEFNMRDFFEEIKNNCVK